MKQIGNRQNIFLLKFRGKKHAGYKTYRLDQKKKKHQVFSEKRSSGP